MVIKEVSFSAVKIPVDAVRGVTVVVEVANNTPRNTIARVVVRDREKEGDLVLVDAGA